LISRSKAIFSDDGTGTVFCSKARPSECCVVMTAINKQRSSIYRGELSATKLSGKGAPITEVEEIMKNGCAISSIKVGVSTDRWRLLRKL
jgi:hypothetical protein